MIDLPELPYVQDFPLRLTTKCNCLHVPYEHGYLGCLMGECDCSAHWELAELP